MSRKVGWSVELKGRDRDLAELARHFTEGSATVANESGAYIVWADVLTGFSMDEHAAARVRAEESVRHMNAAAMIVSPALQPAQIGSLRWTNEDGDSRQFVSAVLRLKYWTGLPQSEDAIPAEAARILELSRTHDSVKWALNLLYDPEPAWPALYSAREAAVNGLGGQAKAAASVGVPEGQLERLRRTSLNQDNLARLGEGDESEARHADATIAPIPNPMPKREAIDLTRRLARAWLRTLM